MTGLTPPEWIEPRGYQQQAIQRWFDADGRGVLRMATGTGKTVTALQAASQVTASAESSFVLIVAVPYQHLVDQWAEEIRNFGETPVLAYQSRRNWQPDLEQELLEVNRGQRDISIVVTTHQTLASNATHKTLSRAAVPLMLVGDEVHHLGAPQMQEGLLDEAAFRLGLSATPERWYDDTGTAALTEYFGETVFEYGIDEAITAGFLCEYYYIPHIVELTDEELEVYEQLTAEIGALMPDTDEHEAFDLDDHPQLKTLLIKRARLIGTAEQKLSILTELLSRQQRPEHTLVYCSDGSVGPEPGEGERHVDVTTERVQANCGLDVSRFTARESQSKRDQLLEAFDTGEIDILTAIRCLDEGIDVPATRTAYILASTTNPRQYIQRRGRILRPHPDKDIAVIHDFITVPDADTHPEYLGETRYSSERSLVRTELERASTFADAARNHPDAEVTNIPTTDGSLQELKREYDLLDI